MLKDLADAEKRVTSVVYSTSNRNFEICGKQGCHLLLHPSWAFSFLSVENNLCWYGLWTFYTCDGSPLKAEIDVISNLQLIV